jgi:hypothetical protein
MAWSSSTTTHWMDRPLSGFSAVRLVFAWLNNVRELRVRREKKAENYQALVMLASALILYRLIVLE